MLGSVVCGPHGSVHEKCLKIVQQCMWGILMSVNIELMSLSSVKMNV